MMQRRKQIRGPEDSRTSEPEDAAPPGLRSEEQATREGSAVKGAGEAGGGRRRAGAGGERDTQFGPATQPAAASDAWANRSLRVPEQPVPTTHTCSEPPAEALVTITVAGLP
jgi:hypothetical protein